MYKKILFTRQTLYLLQMLYRLGVISNFLIVNNKLKKPQHLKFTVFFYKNSPFFKHVKVISTSSKKFYIKFLSLKLVKRVFKNSLIIISTNKGLLTLSEALSLGVGGKLIYILN